MLMSGIRMYVSSNCMTRTTNCAAASTSTCMPVKNKRGGAWMDDCVGQMRKADGSLQKPVAYLTCNFNRPVNGKPALFTHDEVITLFHEFGHGLHHMLTRIETAGVSGISGGAVGCGRTAESVYGKLVLGA